jgi:flagellar biosynthetic protein FliQ
MSPEQATDIFRQALFVALKISAPLLALAMVVGFTISIFQSVTQINEMTLSFVPKIIIFVMALGGLFPWILKTMITYTLNILVYQWDKVVSLSSYTQ